MGPERNARHSSVLPLDTAFPRNTLLHHRCHLPHSSKLCKPFQHIHSHFKSPPPANITQHPLPCVVHSDIATRRRVILPSREGFNSPFHGAYLTGLSQFETLLVNSIFMHHSHFGILHWRFARWDTNLDQGRLVGCPQLIAHFCPFGRDQTLPYRLWCQWKCPHVGVVFESGECCHAIAYHRSRRRGARGFAPPFWRTTRVRFGFGDIYVGFLDHCTLSFFQVPLTCLH
jgi:hypothetical protein